MRLFESVFREPAQTTHLRREVRRYNPPWSPACGVCSDRLSLRMLWITHPLGLPCSPLSDWTPRALSLRFQDPQRQHHPDKFQVKRHPQAQQLSPSSNPPRSTVPGNAASPFDARGVSAFPYTGSIPASESSIRGRDTAFSDGTTSRFAKSWTISNNQKDDVRLELHQTRTKDV